jgi:hypothetical protein
MAPGYVQTEQASGVGERGRLRTKDLAATGESRQ